MGLVAQSLRDTKALAIHNPLDLETKAPMQPVCPQGLLPLARLPLPSHTTFHQAAFQRVTYSFLATADQSCPGRTRNSLLSAGLNESYLLQRDLNTFQVWPSLGMVPQPSGTIYFLFSLQLFLYQGEYFLV